MRKHDLILAGVIILITLTGFGGLIFYQGQNENKPRFAVITQNNELVERIDLNAVEEPREIILPGPYHEIIQVEKGRIRFKSADCPDRICVRAGWLQNPGDMAVCLPNKAIVRIIEN